MHDDLKRLLRDEVDAELGIRPPRNLSDALARGRRKRLALRLVTTMSMVVVGTALVVGGLSIGRELSSDEALPPANPDSDATVVDFPNLTTTFVSPRNGFSVKHPDRAEVTPADQMWGVSEQVDDGIGVDVVETGLAAVFKGTSTDLTESSIIDAYGSIDEWVDDYVSPDRCGGPRSQQAEITVDGQSGRIAECPKEIEATVVAGGRFYLFTLEHDRSDARAVFDAFVATIDLTPETAVELPAMTTTFVSPTYGYSFKYLDRGKSTLKPANTVDDRFDAVETGLGAYFSAASTQIPDGVSIDERVDEYLSDESVSPRGCGVPRSHQAEITIDGQPGRIAECPNQIEATVVAGGRLYLFILQHDRSDARAFFDAWVDTIDLTPETAAVP